MVLTFRIGSKSTKAALEGLEPLDKWPQVKRVTPPEDRIVYRGVGSGLFHGYEKG